MAAEVAWDVRGRWLVQLFHRNNTDFMLPYDCRKWDTAHYTYKLLLLPLKTSTFHQYEQGKGENWFWLDREFWKLANGICRPASVNSSCKWIVNCSVFTVLYCRLLKNLKGSLKNRGRVLKMLNVRLQRRLSLPRYVEPYHFQANLTWWDGPVLSLKSFWVTGQVRPTGISAY